MVDTSSLERIESFPYRHRVHEVMGSPVLIAPPETLIAEACRRMADAGVSSLVVADDRERPIGIVTERDVMRAVARHRGQAVDLPLSEVMSSPVVTVRDDALLYVAMGRMDRLKLRHLVATDRLGRATGMVTVRGLLKLRSATALALGDAVITASEAAAMARAREQLPTLARALLGEGIDAMGIAAVASSVLRDMTARAAQLAEQSMHDQGWGGAPAPFCVLLLGSGGRRESLFGADQDNAIIYDGPTTHDGWFAELGRRMNQTLDEVGVPLCKGGVMAGNAKWRQNLEGWRDAIDGWMREADGEELLNVAIFCDFRAVHGEVLLADAIRAHLTEAAASSPKFLQAMAGTVSGMGTALGLFGRFKTQEGRFDVKLTGLLPLVSTVRLLALKHRIPATRTAERLRALADQGHLGEREAEGFIEGHELMVRALLQQQLADLDAGRTINNRVDPYVLRRHDRSRLKGVFKSLGSLNWVLSSALDTA